MHNLTLDHRTGPATIMGVLLGEEVIDGLAVTEGNNGREYYRIFGYSSRLDNI